MILAILLQIERAHLDVFDKLDPLAYFGGFTQLQTGRRRGHLFLLDGRDHRRRWFFQYRFHAPLPRCFCRKVASFSRVKVSARFRTLPVREALAFFGAVFVKRKKHTLAETLVRTFHVGAGAAGDCSQRRPAIGVVRVDRAQRAVVGDVNVARVAGVGRARHVLTGLARGLHAPPTSLGACQSTGRRRLGLTFLPSRCGVHGVAPDCGRLVRRRPPGRVLAQIIARDEKHGNATRCIPLNNSLSCVCTQLVGSPSRSSLHPPIPAYTEFLHLVNELPASQGSHPCDGSCEREGTDPGVSSTQSRAHCNAINHPSNLPTPPTGCLPTLPMTCVF